MNHTRLIFTVFSVIVGILLFAIWSNVYVYAQQSSPPSAGSSSSSTTTISPELKAKMCNPSNPSLKVVNTTESRICGIPKTVKPSTNATTANTTAGSAAVTSTIKPTAAVASSTAPSKQQQQITTSPSTSAATERSIAPVSSPSENKSLSSSPVIAPQVSALNQQQEPQLLTTSNDTAGQNFTFTSNSTVLTLGKLMYLGYHGDTTNNGSTGKGTSDSKPPVHHSSSSSTHHEPTHHSSSSNHSDHDSNGSGKGKKKSSSKAHSSGGDSFFGSDSFF